MNCIITLLLVGALKIGFFNPLVILTITWPCLIATDTEVMSHTDKVDQLSGMHHILAH